MTPRCKEMIGFADDELGNHVDDWVQRIHAEDVAKTLAMAQDFLAGKTPAYSSEYRIRCKDGRYKWLLTRGIAVTHSPSGKPLRIIGIHSDITQRKASEAELLQAKQEAEHANRAKSQFLATMSHEIRTPMNGILGMAQVLLMSKLSESEREEHIRTIYSSGQTLLTLLNDILDLSKIEAGKIVLESIAMDPAKVIADTQLLFAQLASSKGLQLDVKWIGSKQHYLGDPHRLTQMLSNLVGNAIKFTQRGRICIEGREVECIDKTATLEFSVTDEGVGVAKDKQGLLFQPFSQSDSSTTRHFGGSGLGLSIVRTLAQLMRGEAGIQSEIQIS